MASQKTARLTVGAISLAVLAGAIGRAYFVQGLGQPVRIAGGSMAESLRGDHYRLACGECGFPVRYDADAPPKDNRVVCPNCGGMNSHEDGVFHRGQRVLIDRAAYLGNGPRRWDVVAFPEPHATDRLAVKRVIGLPGEYVGIRHGDIYIDDRRQQKTLEQLRAVAVLVHDQSYRPALSDRWQRTGATSLSQPPADGKADPRIILDQPLGRTGRLIPMPSCESLTYHHWRCFDSPRPRTELSPVLDNCSYNQNESRQLQRVFDLLLVCHLTVTGGDGTVSFAIHDGFERYEVQLSPRGQWGSLCGRSLGEMRFRLPHCPFARGVRIELATCDRRLLFAIDGRVLLEYDCGPRPAGAAFEPASGDALPCPLSIHTRGLSATVQRLQVWRDLYYLDPRGLGRDWSAPRALADDEYFVVGDNVAISQDSRHGPDFAVPRRAILGQVR